MVKEAGGRAGSTRGEDYHIRIFDTLATNGHIHDEIIDVLKKANADRVESECSVCWTIGNIDFRDSFYFSFPFISSSFTSISLFLDLNRL